MSRPGMATVDAHNNGDCWPPSCPICQLEDAEECLHDLPAENGHCPSCGLAVVEYPLPPE